MILLWFELDINKIAVLSFYWGVDGRHGVNSIPELELMVNSNSGIGIDYIKKWIGIEKFLIGIEKSWIGIEKQVSYITIKSKN